MDHRLIKSVAGVLGAVASSLVIGGCADPETSQAGSFQAVSSRTPATREMARRLAVLREQTDPTVNTYEAGRLADLLGGAEPPPDLPSRVRARVLLANALLHAGRTEEAIEALRKTRHELETTLESPDPIFMANLARLEAISELRLGEQRHCIGRHGADACLLPIQGGGIHHDPQPARRAIERYQKILEEEPDDLSSRWLLNLAAMSAGVHPQEVDPRWLIPRSTFDSEAPSPRFTDVAPKLAVDVSGLSGGVVADDLDGDGWIDLMISSWSLEDEIRVFLNDRHGGFVDHTDQAGLDGIVGGLNLIHADYDNDGDNDVFVLRGAWLGRGGRHPNSLLRNRGDGSFDDVTEQAGLLDFRPTQTAAWGDYDNDGWLDLYVGHESGSELHRSRLYRNLGDGRFLEVGAELGADVAGFVKGVVWGDYDNDGWLDLYVSRIDGPNLLLHNEVGPGGRRFLNRAVKAGVTEPLASFPTWWFDVDNDGCLDLFVSGYSPDILAVDAGDVAADYLGLDGVASRPRLYINRCDGTFADETVERGLDHALYSMGANYGDIDSDGWSDLYLGTGAPDLRSLMPNRLFVNPGGDRFADATTSANVGHLQKGHGVAFADFDRDYDLDLYTVLGGAFSGDVYQNALFDNPGSGNRMVVLRLRGVEANRSAIGARLTAWFSDGGETRRVEAVVGTGGSFGSQSLEAEIGLGRAAVLDRLEVRWPGSLEPQVFEGLAAGVVWLLTEGETEPRTF